MGIGRMQGDKAGAGIGGSCVCPNCGYRLGHARGSPCMNHTCPKCGSKMTRA